MAKHTPGPWVADGSIVRQESSEDWIASCPHLMGEIGQDIARANARLIAAAPDLLEALRPFLLPNLKDDGAARDDRPIFGVNDSLITVGDLRRARAAIAKAEGR